MRTMIQLYCVVQLQDLLTADVHKGMKAVLIYNQPLVSLVLTVKYCHNYEMLAQAV